VLFGQDRADESDQGAAAGEDAHDVGVFPNAAALLRLAGSVLIEQHDEWEAGERRYFSEASMLELAVMNNPVEVIDEAVILPELAAA
jgi:putative transposase